MMRMIVAIMVFSVHNDFLLYPCITNLHVLQEIVHAFRLLFIYY